MQTFKVGDKVWFGRENGQHTMGEVVKINPTRIKVRQLEERSHYPVGTVWTVSPTLLRIADRTRADILHELALAKANVERLERELAVA